MKLATLASKKFSDSFQVLMKLKGIPVETLFKLRKLAKEVEKEASVYESVKQSIIDEFAEKDEKGKTIVEAGNVKISAEKATAFYNKMKDLAAEEVELPKIKFSDLGTSPELTPEDIFFLDFIEE